MEKKNRIKEKKKYSRIMIDWFKKEGNDMRRKDERKKKCFKEKKREKKDYMKRM